MLCCAVAQLHEVAIIQADIRDVAVVGGIDNARGRRSQAQRIDHVAQVSNDLGGIKWAVFDGSHDEVTGGVERGMGDLFVPCPNDDLIELLG